MGFTADGSRSVRPGFLGTGSGDSGDMGTGKGPELETREGPRGTPEGDGEMSTG